MKIKIIDCGSCPYITLGKVYDVIAKDDKRVGWWDIIDDEGDTYTVETLDDPENIVAVEVVQEEPEHKTPKFKVGDKVACLKSDVLNELFIDKIGVVVRVYAEYDHEPSYEVNFREFSQICCEVLDEMVLVESCPDPMPVVEPEDFLEQPTDNVNNPSHYGNGQIECIDYLEDFMTTEEFIGYLRGNIGKYLHRWRYKNGLEDLRKAEWYLKKLIEVYND